MPLINNKNIPDTIIEGLKKVLSNQLIEYPKTSNLKKWLELISGEITFDEIYKLFQNDSELTYLTIDTTGLCDLKCSGVCYYNPNINTKKQQVSINALKQAIEDAKNKLNLKALVIAGKEPFINPGRLFEILKVIGKNTRPFDLGIITNGRHIDKHKEKLISMAEKRAFDFIDISIDSAFEEQHDLFRGIKGTFQLAFQAVKELNEYLPHIRVGISSVLHNDNQEGLLELIKKTSVFNKYFWIGPIMPPVFSKIYPLNTEVIVDFIFKLQHFLENDIKDKSVEVIFDFPSFYLYDIINAGIFQWEEIKEDLSPNFCVSKRFNDNGLIFTFRILPEYGWKTSRITYTGDYLAHLHFLQSPTPEKYAVGNINAESIVSLFNKAKNLESYFYKIIKSREKHDCKDKPCWNNCFGGWTMAENNILSEQALTEKPNICLKN